MKSRNLGKLEQKVMDIMWSQNKSSIKDVHQMLQKKKSIAYTTVATILYRLCNKGFLLKKQEQNKLIYSPKFSKPQYTKTIAKNFFSNFVNKFGEVAMTSFAESIDNLPKKKRDHLLKLLKEHGTK